MSLKKKTIHGLAWAFTSQIGKQGSQFVITAILARLLSPSDFGLLGMATVFTNFAMIFGELGVSSALIQKQDADERHLSSAFWLNIMAGIGLTLIFILLSPLIAKFYNRPELKPMLMVMSFNYILASFTIIQQSILTKDMDFRSLMIRDIIAVIVAGIVGIAMAYKGFGVWSLVYQLLTFTAINGILLWTFSKWRPKFIFSLTAIRDIFHFSVHMTGFQTVNYFARNIDYLLIGKFLGAQPLGYYTLAYRLMLMPLQNVSSVIGRVMFPAFSKIQDELEKIHSGYLKMIKAISSITFPLMLLLFAVTTEFVNVIFGSNWQPSIILIRILCFCGLVQSVGGPIVGTLRLSQGEARLHFKLGVLNAIFSGLSILLGLRWGIYGVALSYTVFSVFWSYYTNLVTFPLIKLSMAKFFASLTYPTINAFIVMLSTIALKSILPFSQLINLVILAIAGLLVYSFLLLFTKQLLVVNKKIIFNF